MLPSNVIKVDEFSAEIVLVMRSGEILMVSERLHENPKGSLDGAVFEVMLQTDDGKHPYFVYYKCDEYYFNVQDYGDFDKAQMMNQWRVFASNWAGSYVALYMAAKYPGLNHPHILSFSHNRRHTNVLAYVPSLGNWYPIRHHDEEPEAATEHKVALIDRGLRKVTDFVSVDDVSPHAAAPVKKTGYQSWYPWISEGHSAQVMRELREALLVDIKCSKEDPPYEDVADKILRVSFGLNESAWLRFEVTETLEYHVFYEIYDIDKNNKLNLYPDADELLFLYTKKYVHEKIRRCPSAEDYRRCRSWLNGFLSAFEEEDARRIRNRIIYSAHKGLLARDFGDMRGLSSDCRGVIKEAEEFLGLNDA